MPDLISAVEAIEFVKNDVSGYFGEIFTREDDEETQFVVEQKFHGNPGEDDTSALANELSAVVVWEFSGRHTSDFEYIEATGRDVVVQGCSVVSKDLDVDELRIRHYVNWVGVLGQLGVTFTRPLIAEDALRAV
jgi:hypothetical protein